MAKKKPKPRSKVTLEMPTALKRRLMAYAGATGQHPWRVVERAVKRELANFKFEGAGTLAAPDQADSPILKIG
jgi:hypothetical protein